MSAITLSNRSTVSQGFQSNPKTQSRSPLRTPHPTTTGLASALQKTVAPNATRAAILLVTALALLVPDAGLREVVIATLADAYLAVSVFVAATLFLFYGLERRFGFDTGAILERHAAWQVPIAALLGALPGCGGAIVVLTQYVAGRANFGAVVAVLTATMGDAAFVLLAAEPGTAALVSAVSIVAGIAAGVAINAIHGTDFMRHTNSTTTPNTQALTPDGAQDKMGPLFHPIWIALFIPGLVLGISDAAQIDVDAMVSTVIALGDHSAVEIFGAIGAAVALLMWSRTRGEMTAHRANSHAQPKAVSNRVASETNFVTAWVVFGFLVFEVGVYVTGFDLGAAFKTVAPTIPLIGVLVGLLPGCGPQIIVTTLYVNGLIPLSAQMGNALSNDGDALFPAIALAPKAAVVATAYSAVPALIVAYSWYGLFE
ncbi:MAG: putative manganese transporter [Pseudomonadota bacterium]